MIGRGPDGAGAQWDEDTTGLIHNRTRLVHIGNGTQRDLSTMGGGHNGTGAQLDEGHSGTVSQWDWNTTRLVYNGTGI